MQGKEIVILQVLKIVFYKVPFLAFEFLPFIFLFGAILTFTKMNNNSEFTAIKSAGVSIWTICFPIIIAIGAISIVNMWVFQPVSAIFLGQNHLLQNKHLGRTSHRVSLQSNGIWLYDQTNNPQDNKIITLKHVKGENKLLSKVMVYYSGENKDFTTSYVAESALIEGSELILNNLMKYTPGSEAIHYDKLILPTSLQLQQIQEAIPNPDIIPLWDLDKFIDQLKQLGFFSLKHELYYNSMLASPLLYISLVLIALACSLNLPRKGKLGIVFVTGGLIGIGIFFINRMINVLVLTGGLPVIFGVMAPSIAYILISFAILIHSEEG